jgi:hypothetical protein
MRNALIALLTALTATAAAAQTGKEGAPARSMQAPPLDPAMLIGRWGDNGDCTKDIVFQADGTFRSFTGGEGRWYVSGDRLTFSGAGGVFEVGVRWLDANTMNVINADGTVGVSQRCS